MKNSKRRAVKLNNLRRLFNLMNETNHIYIKDFAKTHNERPDLMGKYLYDKREPSDKKIADWCAYRQVDAEEYYGESPQATWPPVKKGHR